MERLDEIKIKAMPLACEIADLVNSYNLDIYSVFYAVESLLTQVVAEMCVYHSIDKDVVMRCFQKELAEKIDKLTAPKIP